MVVLVGWVLAMIKNRISSVHSFSIPFAVITGKSVSHTVRASNSFPNTSGTSSKGMQIEHRLLPAMVPTSPLGKGPMICLSGSCSNSSNCRSMDSAITVVVVRPK